MQTQKILIVDDEASIVDWMSDILSRNAYEVLAAFNGEMALSVIQKTEPNLMIIDWDMPVKNGIDTVKELKQLPKLREIPVIMITGRMTSVDDLKTAFDAGVIDFIRKPVEPVELQARIRSVLLLDSYYKETLRMKNWELTTLSGINHQNDQLMGELMKLCDEVMGSCNNIDHFRQKDIKERVNRLKANMRNNSWELFQDYFQNVHPGFSEALLRSYPKLSSEEIKLCHFLRLNMSSKEIASLTNKAMSSVDIARYRLRKKLKIEHEVKLHEFLARF
ncbi:response regulator [Roseimarinus sediminis]|uniref:response regulator n=1 Tax=Roseimarinus sediminis TaxID=1610899 RepID=UPI003D1BAF61